MEVYNGERGYGHNGMHLALASEIPLHIELCQLTWMFPEHMVSSFARRAVYPVEVDGAEGHEGPGD